MLFRPEALLELREDMMLAISSLSVGCRNYVLLVSFERCLYEYFMLICRSFSYRGKVFIKGIRNIIEIACSITIIKGGYCRCMGCYSFWKNNGFDSFPCVLNIIPFSFNIFIIISLFTFLYNGRE